MLAPGTNIGRYLIRKRLAEGGMAEVFLAQAIGPEGFAKDVVIKVVRGFLSRDQQFIDMFINEARLSSRLNHANVVQIFDFGKHEQSYFIAMEYVHGTSLFELRSRCRERSIPFPPTLVAEIGAQVARGLQYAHSLADKGKPLGIVHRDVTPHNVLLSFDGAVKLTDFGIAKASTTHTAPGVLKGKFAYMSPEQARGEVVDARTDIFALGVVLWEMLTGGRLFDGDTELAVLRAVQDSLIAAPSRLNPDVPQELSDIVLKALSRPPAERFQTAFEFEKALATFVLRAAKSVEDSSVSLFLQQLYREELEAESRPMTPIAAPAVQRGASPQAASFESGDTLAVDRSAELARGRAQQEALAPTHQRPGVQRGPESPTAPLPGLPPPVRGGPATEKLSPIKTDQLPGLAQPSAKTDQLPSLAPRGSADAFGSERTAPGDKGTDSARQPLAPVKDNSGVRMSDSLRREVMAQATSPALDPVVNDATVKQRVLTVRDSRPTGPTEADTPPPAKRSPAVLVGSLVAAALVLAGGGYALFGPRVNTGATATPVEPLAAVTAKPPQEPATEPPPIAQPTPPEPAPPAVLAPVAEAPVDAGPPEVAAKPPDAKPAEVKRADAKPADAKVVEPRPSNRTAPVAIKAIPFAEIFIDGRKVGEVQGTKTIKVPFGKHQVRLEHPKRTENFDVDVDGTSTPAISFDAFR